MKLFEPGPSLVCYHCRKEWGACPASLFLSLPENSATAELNSISDWKEKDVPRLMEDNLQRILINQFCAITVAPQLTAEHDPPMNEAEWIQANAFSIREVGAERWLKRLLDVLGGDIVTAEKVGLAPPGGLFDYYTPGSSNAQRRGKKRNGKRGTTSKRGCFRIVCSYPEFLAQGGSAVL